MPITLTYDLTDLDSNQRTYLRSMLERFGWERRGGSTFRYKGRETEDGLYEDWLNDVAPSLMYFRSYVLEIDAHINHFTIDAMSSRVLDHSDLSALLGEQPLAGDALELVEPTNITSNEQRIRDFVDTAAEAAVLG